MKQLIIAYATLPKLPQMTDDDIRKLDVLNVAFALVEDGKVVLKTETDLGCLAHFRQVNPNMKQVISIGGWGAGGFSEAARTPESRDLFAATAIELMRKWNFDGVDMDWEFPTHPQGDIAACKEDRQNFTAIIARLRQELDRFEAQDGKKYLLSIAAGADLYYLDATEMEKVASYLDYVQLMTYDMRCGFQSITGHHANLYNSTGDIFRISADASARNFEAAGVPRDKIVLGAAFYSRKWVHVPNKRNGLFVIAEKPSPEGTIYSCGEHGPRYGDLVENYINKNGFTRYWDDEAKAPWVYDGSTFLSYDDEQSISCKVEYIKERGLKGLMFWEYFYDPTHTLLDTMYREFNK